jgi:hypothetical protein
MPKHLQTAKHEREMQGRENNEVVEHYKYKLAVACIIM